MKNKIKYIDEMQLPVGTHTYTFQCLLPAGLPTSVDHSVGHITYSANVVLDIPVNIHFIYFPFHSFVNFFYHYACFFLSQIETFQ